MKTKKGRSINKLVEKTFLEWLEEEQRRVDKIFFQMSGVNKYILGKRE